MKISKLRLPRRFFYDHAERDLPTPVVIRETKSHVFVDAHDPAIGELINDAEYYTNPYGPYGGAGLKKSAFATILAYEKWRGEYLNTWHEENDADAFKKLAQYFRNRPNMDK